MITETLIGTACFIAGFVISTLVGAKMVMNANKLYHEETGEDFVSWVFNTSNKKRVEQIKADLEIHVED